MDKWWEEKEPKSNGYWYKMYSRSCPAGSHRLNVAGNICNTTLTSEVHVYILVVGSRWSGAHYKTQMGSDVT